MGYEDSRDTNGSRVRPHQHRRPRRLGWPRTPDFQSAGVAFPFGDFQRSRPTICLRSARAATATPRGIGARSGPRDTIVRHSGARASVLPYALLRQSLGDPHPQQRLIGKAHPVRRALGRRDLALLQPEGDGLLGARSDTSAQGRRGLRRHGRQVLGVAGGIALCPVVRGLAVGRPGSCDGLS
jgi:hypothetical protein